MDRIDSGFDGSYCLGAPVKEPHSVQRSNTAPTCPRKSGRKNQKSPRVHQISSMEDKRPASEKRSSGHRQSMEPRRKSTASSSEVSNKSRNRGNGSKPSSRRTSITLVDPSRPARHYRIRSSQTVPTTNRDIDDVLALHFRSCSLFQNPSYYSGHHNIPSTKYGNVNAEDGSMRNTVSATTPQRDADRIEHIDTIVQDKGLVVERAVEDTTMHWTSPSTRKLEYDKIDRANSGIRGLVRKIVPRCVSGPPTPRFYEKDHDDDACSVRRYRMSISEDEVDEKDPSLLQHQNRKLEKSTCKKAAKSKTKLWGCF